MISRVQKQNSKENYMQKWFPSENVNLSMNYFIIPERHKLVKYVLHAKHSAVSKKAEEQNLKMIYKENFTSVWEAAKASLQWKNLLP